MMPVWVTLPFGIVLFFLGAMACYYFIPRRRRTRVPSGMRTTVRTEAEREAYIQGFGDGAVMVSQHGRVYAARQYQGMIESEARNK